MDVYDILTEYININCTKISEDEYIEVEYVEKEE